jgi:nucleotide-binding universal stress UspA family protein
MAITVAPAVPGLDNRQGLHAAAAYSRVHTGGFMYKKLLVPVDGSDLTERAMSQSIALARQLGASIIAFVVEPDMPLPNVGTRPQTYHRQLDEHETRTDTHAHELLSQFGERARAAGVAFSGRHARTDQVDTAIARAAADFECDMIVMATHGRGVFGELLFGSHTKSVLAKSTVPLLVLR